MSNDKTFVSLKFPEHRSFIENSLSMNLPLQTELGVCYSLASRLFLHFPDVFMMKIKNFFISFPFHLMFWNKKPTKDEYFLESKKAKENPSRSLSYKVILIKLNRINTNEIKIQMKSMQMSRAPREFVIRRWVKSFVPEQKLSGCGFSLLEARIN